MLAIIADTSNHIAALQPQPSLPHCHGSTAAKSYDHDRDGTMLGAVGSKFRIAEHETVITAIRYEGDRLTMSHDLFNRRA